MYASTKSWQNGLIKPIILISIEIEFGIAIFYDLSAFRISNVVKNDFECTFRVCVRFPSPAFVPFMFTETERKLDN